MNISKPRGTQDFFENEYLSRRDLEDKFVAFFGKEKKYLGIETPIFEQRNLFVRSVGDETDIVQKELFDLAQKSDEVYSLRPELTAGIIRFLVENGSLKSRPKPINVFALGPCFRYEKPQRGRRRQFNQLDLESIGKKSAELDAGFIIDVVDFLDRIGLKKITVNINCFGSQGTKEKYSAEIKQFLKKNSPDLCETCLRRAEKNPLRVLDCKNEKCRTIVSLAPQIKLSQQENEEFNKIIEILRKSFSQKKGAKIVIDPMLVRGLDYYTGIVFEISVEGDESRMGSIGGGGRYDGLIRELGGPDMPAVGIGLGFERVVDFLNSK